MTVAGMTYDLFEHRHRFAVWAAARAAQRGYTSISVLREALEGSDIVVFLRDPASVECGVSRFDQLHLHWCRSIFTTLHNQGIAGTSFGRVAKLVAVYLKAMVVTGPLGTSPLAAVIHPPIDRILLQNIAAARGSDYSESSSRASFLARLPRGTAP
jgi:hypothetical protein